MSYYDFNTAEEQTNFDAIPKGTLAKVRMTIKPGGYDDVNNGWTGGYATHKAESGAVYLSCEYVVLEGEYAKRKVWSMIGLYSHKNNNAWGNMGRSFIRAILNSARGLSGKDNSAQAQALRRINGLGDLDGIEFVAKIDVSKDQNGNDRNEIKIAITPDSKDYAAVMGQIAPVSATANTTQAPAQQQGQPVNAAGKPSWAQ